MPAAGPFMAAITGLGILRNRVSIRMYPLRSTFPTSSGVRIPPSAVGSSVTSAPEQNARPEPVSTTTRTASSRSACLIASPSCLRVSAPIAFIFSGRFSWIKPTPSWTWSVTCCSTSVAISYLPVITPRNLRFRGDPDFYSPASCSVGHDSSSLEDAFSLFEECVHAFLLVLGREQEVEALALRGQALRQRRLERLEYRFLGHPQRERRFFGQLPGGPLRDFDRHLGRHDLVDETQLVGAPRRHRRARQHRLHGGVLSRRARPALRAAGARDDAEIDLRLSESRGVAGNDQVAHQRELAAAAQGVAVQRGDQRLAERGDACPPAGLVAAKLVDGGLVGHVADVRPGGEHLPPAREHHGTDSVVRVELDQCDIDLADEIRAEGVQDLRPVQRDGRDRGLDVNQDVLVSHRRLPPVIWFQARFVTPSGGSRTTSGSRSPTAATSAASTACRRRDSSG